MGCSISTFFPIVWMETANFRKASNTNAGHEILDEFCSENGGSLEKEKKTIVNSSIFGGELLVLGDGKKSALKTDEMNFETTEELHTPKWAWYKALEGGLTSHEGCDTTYLGKIMRSSEPQSLGYSWEFRVSRW